jgi:hypothetical protein
MWRYKTGGTKLWQRQPQILITVIVISVGWTCFFGYLFNLPNRVSVGRPCASRMIFMQSVMHSVAAVLGIEGIAT